MKAEAAEAARASAVRVEVRLEPSDLAVEVEDLVEEASFLPCPRRGANTHPIPVRHLRQQLCLGRQQMLVL